MFQPLEERIEEEIANGGVSDVCFVAGPSQDVRLFSSRSVLAIASSVFRTMFFSPPWSSRASCSSAEAGGCPSSPPSSSIAMAAVDSVPAPLSHRCDSSAPGCMDPSRHLYVAVPDVEPSAMRCMLRYVHHLDPQLTLDNVLHVYRAADKYQIDGLLVASSAFIDDLTDPHDVEQTLRLFDASCRLGIERYASRFLHRLAELSRLQTWRLLRAEDFVTLHPASMATLLGSEGFCVEEEMLWVALRRWAELRASSARMCDAGDALAQGLAGAPAEAAEDAASSAYMASSSSAPVDTSAPVSRWQDVLRPLKRLIRFPTMSIDFFAREVAQSDVLTPEEAVSVFCHLSSRGGAGEWGGPRGQRDGTAVEEDAQDEEVLVADHFRTSPRALCLGFCSVPGVAEAPLVEECGPLLSANLAGASAQPARSTTALVLDGRGLCPGRWGPSIVLGGGGTGFHFAFGSVGFSSGRHAWTISWLPLDVPRGGAPRSGRGGAAGIAREGDARGASPAPSASGACGLVAPKAFSGALAAAGVSSSRAAAGAATAASPGAVAAGAAIAGAGAAAAGVGDDLAARFLDWPTCFVFGLKREVSERRYVSWEPPEDAASVADACVRFAIVLDFDSRIVTYIADGGERCWTAPLAHPGVVYPVIAASGPHHFRIQYGVHL